MPGLSVGAAYYVYHQILGQPRTFVMDHAYWGPQFTPEAIEQALESSQVRDLGFPVKKLSDEELLRLTAQHLADGKIVGWYQGRQEWGPRALGQPKHSRGPAPGGNERHPEPADQAPGTLPSVRSLDSGRSHRAVFSSAPTLRPL